MLSRRACAEILSKRLGDTEGRAIERPRESARRGSPTATLALAGTVKATARISEPRCWHRRQAEDCLQPLVNEVGPLQLVA